MPVDAQTRRLLLRWQALTKPEELQRAKSTVLRLWMLGLIIFLIVLAAIVKGLSPLVVAFGGIAVGWLMAEANALRARVAYWGTFQRYLDWDRIQQDLKDAT
jgi:hypothetical protein